MRSACDYRFHMAKMIQIRNVPDEVHRKLKVRAAKEGITLSEMLGREARRLAELPTLDEMRERLLSRPRVKLKTSPAQIIREMRDRT
jgi:plasmid stability protein